MFDCTGKEQEYLSHSEDTDSEEDLPEPQSLEELKKDKRNVGIAIAVEGLSDIREAEGTFHANFSLMMWIYLEETVGKESDEAKPNIPPEKWLVTSAMDAELCREVGWNDNEFLKYAGDGWNYVTFFFKGTWCQSYDVRHFPYDVQRLWLTIRFNSVMYPRRLCLDKKISSAYRNGLRINQKLSTDRWTIVSPTLVLASAKVKYLDQLASENCRWLMRQQLTMPSWLLRLLRPGSVNTPLQPHAADDVQRLFLAFTAERASAYYMRSIYFPTFCSNLLTFLLFASPIEDSATKISTGLTLVLTVIAIRFVVDGLLVPVSHTTPAERYITFSIAFTSTTTFMHSFAARFCLEWDGEEKEKIEWFLFIAQTAIFVLEHLWSVCRQIVEMRLTRSSQEDAV